MKKYFRGLYRSDEGFWKHEYNDMDIVIIKEII